MTIDLTAPTYVPFEPKTPEQRAARAELRERISGLVAGPGEILYANLSGALPRGADVENALFYNLDAAGVFAAMSHGVSFESAPEALATGVRYRYDTGPAEQRFRYWGPDRDLARLDAHLGELAPKLPSIWWALRSADGSIQPFGERRSPGETFAVALDVEGPAAGLTPALLKVVLDGTICALQSETDPALATSIAPRVAADVGASTDLVLEALLDDAPSAIGSRSRLVHRHGLGVKWEPDDDFCVAARVLFQQREQWHIAGSVDIALPLTSASR